MFETSEKISPEEIEWKLLTTVNREEIAYLLKGYLESEGVPAAILSQLDTTRNFTLGELAIIKIFVPSALFEKAKSLLARLESEENESLF